MGISKMEKIMNKNYVLYIFITVTTLSSFVYPKGSSSTGVDEMYNTPDDTLQEPDFVPLTKYKRQDSYGLEPEEREIDYNKTYNNSKNAQFYTEKQYNTDYYKNYDFGRRNNRLGVPYFDHKSFDHMTGSKGY